jgi:hypothetical protein
MSELRSRKGKGNKAKAKAAPKAVVEVEKVCQLETTLTADSDCVYCAQVCCAGNLCCGHDVLWQQGEMARLRKADISPPRKCCPSLKLQSQYLSPSLDFHLQHTLQWSDPPESSLRRTLKGERLSRKHSRCVLCNSALTAVVVVCLW